MKIISHRGYWIEKEEKNSEAAFVRSFMNGFGTETDIRDYDGELVISHDIANSKSMSLTDFIKIYKKIDEKLHLALNIKSDGLQRILKEILEENRVENYFLFDMAVPDMMGYVKNGLKVYTRQSEFEALPVLYESAYGVWLDEFETHWISESVIFEHIKNGKRVCIVSPELHGRSYQKEWADYKIIDNKIDSDMLMLCTDKPDEAKEYFNEN